MIFDWVFGIRVFIKWYFGLFIGLDKFYYSILLDDDDCFVWMFRKLLYKVL